MNSMSVNGEAVGGGGRSGVRNKARPIRLVFCLPLLLLIPVILFSLSSRGPAWGCPGTALLHHKRLPSEEAGILFRDIVALQLEVAAAVREIHGSVATSDSEILALGSLLSEMTLSLDLVKTFLASVKAPTTGLKSDSDSNSTLGSGFESDSNSTSDSDVKLISDLVSEDERETDPLVEFFETEEIRKYVRYKPHRGAGHGGGAWVNASGGGAIGHACVGVKDELEAYMGYDVGDFCPEDWALGQRLMVLGCDPLPRRRCLARGPPFYQRPLPINESLWTIPDDRNVRWGSYRCRDFACLRNTSRPRGFYKCNECFDLHGNESLRWVIVNASFIPDFTIADVLAVPSPPGSIRIGLDFSVSVGTFAARMREHNVTIISTALNLGAPFNEIISLRGLIPLYISISQRLPFFDNTLDIVHSALFLDGWIDMHTLDFLLFDWDRVLRPGGLLWVDKFFCHKDDLEEFLYMFLQLRYKKHKWAVAPKTDKDDSEVFFSALLEKPARPV